MLVSIYAFYVYAIYRYTPQEREGKKARKRRRAFRL